MIIPPFLYRDTRVSAACPHHSAGEVWITRMNLTNFSPIYYECLHSSGSESFTLFLDWLVMSLDSNVFARSRFVVYCRKDPKYLIMIICLQEAGQLG